MPTIMEHLAGKSEREVGKQLKRKKSTRKPGESLVQFARRRGKEAGEKAKVTEREQTAKARRAADLRWEQREKAFKKALR